MLGLSVVTKCFTCVRYSTHKETDSGVLEETDPEVNCKFKEVQ